MSTVEKPIRIGVVGVGRGRTFMKAERLGFKLVALCDTWEERLREQAGRWNVTAYTDYDRFLEHDMDAVVLANYFHEHASFAVKAFAAGKHVMSECAACHTPAQGVELARAFERAGDRIYLFAENYPFMAYNQEMRRLYRTGEFGQFRYGEAEYVHPDPASVKNRRSCGYNHWRNWLPWGVYYCTHALGPIMYITDTRPVKVNAFVVPYDFDDPTKTMTASRSDIAGILMCRMDNGAVAKVLQGSLRGHGNYTRIHCNRGLMESCRHGDRSRIRIWREPWEKSDDIPAEVVYKPEFPHHHTEATAAGHGGGDYFTLYAFAEAIRTGRQPWMDVYRGLDMSLAGIFGWRSALNDSAPFEVPDFRSEEVRVRYENDRFTPNPAAPDALRLPSSILGDIAPSPESLAQARRDWAEVGYHGE
ncbi:MAG: Gfo/Idh/MocA family oxidoreductase [Kiritimatiellaeota bacterium]|nr:Gfo/Idh/MocA family oxidoreductase [Kiritimatiellota bacterium]